MHFENVFIKRKGYDMKKLKQFSMAFLITALIAFAIVVFPKLDTFAAGKIEPVSTNLDFSVGDSMNIYFYYTPNSKNTKVEYVLYSSAGKALTNKKSIEYKSSETQLGKIYFIIAPSKGSYYIVLTEYDMSSGTEKATGAKATVNFSIGDKRTGWYKSGSTYYYYNSDGKKQYNWQKISGKWYYFDPLLGSMHTKGWDHDSDTGNWYYFTASGAAATGWQKIDGKWYHFTGGGVMDLSWTKIDGKWYFFKNDGSMATGWTKISGNWYYFEGSGAMVTGWKKLDGKWYYFKSAGAMAKNWTKISGNWYYFGGDGIMRAGWQEIDGNWYYFKSGVMVTGNVELGGKVYTFDSNGVYQKK